MGNGITLPCFMFGSRFSLKDKTQCKKKRIWQSAGKKNEVAGNRGFPPWTKGKSQPERTEQAGCDARVPRVPQQGLLTAAQVMFNLQAAPVDEKSFYPLFGTLSTNTEHIIKGHQDVQKAAQQHWVCADLLWPTEAFEWSSAKALDSDGNLGQGWNQSHASKTKRQNNQGQRAVLRCRARTGSHVFWVKALAGLTLRQPLRHQGCHSPALLPNNRGSNGHHHFPHRLPGSINTTPGCPQEHSLLFESTNLRYWQDIRNCKMSPPTFKDRKLQLREAKHQVWEAREGEKHSKLG